MRLQNEILDWPFQTSWWGMVRRKLLILFPAYRPERHYMRGPGPKWRERHGRP